MTSLITKFVSVQNQIISWSTRNDLKTFYCHSSRAVCRYKIILNIVNAYPFLSLTLQEFCLIFTFMVVLYWTMWFYFYFYGIVQLKSYAWSCRTCYESNVKENILHNWLLLHTKLQQVERKFNFLTSKTKTSAFTVYFLWR